MRIGIIGNGVVGSATAAAFRDHVDEVRCYDCRSERRTHGFTEAVRCDIVFLCLPTPQIPGSLGCNIGYVEGVCKVLSDPGAPRNGNFVLRSTVPIGTTRMLREKYGLANLVHSPEFLSAATAAHDACNPTRNVVGWSDYPHGYPAVAALYQERWPNIPLCVMSSDESEAVKLFQNSYSAVVLATLNEFRCLSDKLGTDWNRIMEALLAGGWLAPRHTNVPGPDGKRGFGGACLPKDLANLIQCFDDAKVQRFVTAAALMRNELIDRKE